VHDWFGFVTYLVAIGSIVVVGALAEGKTFSGGRMKKSKWLVLAAAWA
jgi:hypothetical protein